MANYITRCTLSANGKSETNFNTFDEKGYTGGIQVKLMNETGYAPTTKRYTVELGYVVPQVNPTDYSTFKDGTIRVEYDGGLIINYGDVNFLSVGDSLTDGEKEMIQMYLFSCGTKNGKKGDE
jgi:hypothetical protein